MKTNIRARYPKPTSMMALVAILIATVTLLVGCGKKLSGTYTGEGVPFKQLKFTSGNKVELTTLMDSVNEATYVVEGDKVKISAGGQTQIFTIDKDGCLNGGGMIGKFCKQ